MKESAIQTAGGGLQGGDNEDQGICSFRVKLGRGKGFFLWGCILGRVWYLGKRNGGVRVREAG